MEQQELLGRPTTDVATSNASTDGSPDATADTAPADNPTGSAVDRAARRKASIGWKASTIGHSTAVH